ncbi:carbon storage regulator [Thermanaeromonas sp. C210]|uniref:carbon storage regulator n=1 Tax=Thermanaeromonas sp. C210 TaxID=2731925 RepID=UPI00155D213C|nr:carbon storage regulator [Thermanaeromonas sp. C210]GFN22447.1 hypothetical protein TAMC210_07630 [Thermanaeromonas sp. C210]
MLIITRKEGQSIMIDGRIRVKIVEVIGNYVRVGIEAPEEVPVKRAELLEGAWPASQGGNEAA